MTSADLQAEGRSLSPHELAAVRSLVESIGEAAAAAALGINRQTLYRVLATLSVQRGTVALVRAQLAALNQRKEPNGSH